MKRKDAFTDLVEHVQGSIPTTHAPQPSGDRQVVNQAGEIVTLGQKPTGSDAHPNKGNPLELSEERKKDNKNSVREIIERFLSNRGNK